MCEVLSAYQGRAHSKHSISVECSGITFQSHGALEVATVLQAGPSPFKSTSCLAPTPGS